MSVKCKSCGRDVTPKLSTKQIIIGVLLMFLAIIPGVVYLVLCSKHVCPSCGKNVYTGKDDNLKIDISVKNPEK